MSTLLGLMSHVDGCFVEYISNSPLKEEVEPILVSFMKDDHVVLSAAI